MRTRIRGLRRALATAERRSLALGLSRALLSSPLLLRSGRVACYLANDGEMDLDPLMQRMRRMRKVVLLPAVRGERLWFLPYGPGTPMSRNRFGIPEPRLRWDSRCPRAALDLVLVPLVAVDAAGNRLGMGGGFYDRTFAYLNGRSAWRSPPLIGIGYEFQRVAHIERRPWDVPLSGVATERGLRLFDARV